MELRDFVLQNGKIIQTVNDRLPGNDKIDMYFGTLDYATARFNTIILKLSQDVLLEQQYRKDVVECFNAIQDFYKNVERYRWWPSICRPFLKLRIHWIGTRHITKIKKLLQKLDN